MKYRKPKLTAPSLDGERQILSNHGYSYELYSEMVKIYHLHCRMINKEPACLDAFHSLAKCQWVDNECVRLGLYTHYKGRAQNV